MKNQSLHLVFMLCLLASLCNAQLPSYLPTNGLVAWYPFNGNANDESGNGNDGTVINSTLTTDRNYTAMKAYNFDGVDDYINIGTQVNPSHFTYNLWVYPESIPVEATVILSNLHNIDPYFGNNSEISFHSNGDINIGVSGGVWAFASSTTNISLNQWSMITLTYSGDTLKVFKNGNLSFNQAWGSYINNPINTYIGARPNNVGTTPASLFDGSIDDIGIWDRALLPTEVSSLFNATNSNTGGSGQGTVSNPTPPGIPYQAEVRNESGEVLANTSVNIRFTLHEQAANGAVSYQETHALATNELGLFAATIGAGIAVQGTFASINWAQTTKFLQVAVDTGSGWITMGNQQLMSVPYALYAANGPQGPAGADGQPGTQGEPGENGLSAYEVWLAEGSSGTVSDFLNSQTNNSSTAHGSFQATGLGLFVVPNNVKNIELNMSGSIGGNGGTAIGIGFYQYTGGTGGISGFTRVLIPVNPGDSIMYQIGNNGVNGGNCLATGSCGSSPGCACVGGSGTPGEISTLKLNGVNLFHISGGTGGTGGSYGLPNAPGNGGSQGIVTYSSQSISTGIIPLASNVWNIEQRSILIRY